MTKKNAKKTAARARVRARGGRYEDHLRKVGGLDASAPSRTAERIAGKFIATVNALIELARARRIDEESSKESPIERLERRLRHEPTPERALVRALEALDLVRVLKVRTLMYAGRDDEEIGIMSRFLARSPDVRNTHVAMIAQKLPLDEYLEAGLDRAERDGIDLDGDLSLQEPRSSPASRPPVVEKSVADERVDAHASEVEVAVNWVQALRVRRSWSQAHLAKLTGLSDRTIQRVEAGEDAGLDTLRRIGEALDVPVGLGSPEGRVWCLLAAHADTRGAVNTTWDELGEWLGRDPDIDPHEAAIHLKDDGLFRNAYFEGGPDGACSVTLRL